MKLITRHLICLCISIVMFACAPDYPDDALHQDVDNDDCIACHVDKEVESAPDVPGPHKNISRDDIDRRHEDCKRCHQQAE